MKVTKFRFFIDYEKEEKWLNDMAAQGYHLIDFTFGRYVFEKGKPNEYIYRLQFLDNVVTHSESKHYIQFMEENGVECVSTWYRWVYFRMKAGDGQFDIYSDKNSRLKHYKKVAMFVLLIAGINLFSAILNTIVGLSTDRSLNVLFSIFNWIMVIILTPLSIRDYKKVNQMEKEIESFE